MSKPLVFVSYCQKDAAWRDELLEEVLQPYREMGYIEYWCDKSLEPGTEHKEEILDKLAQASVAICLVSPRFVSSWFIRNEELPRIMQAHQEERMKVLWFLLKPLDLDLLKDDLAKIQAVVNPSSPLSKLDEHARGEVWKDLGVRLRNIAESAKPPILEKQIPAVPAEPPSSHCEAGRFADRISVTRGNLARTHSDVLIVSASSNFWADGGIEKAIHDEAGPGLAKYLKHQRPLELTKALLTPAFNVPAKALVHAVSPRWRGNPGNDLALLQQTYENAFNAAIAAGARSIALGSFGNGLKGFPPDVTAGIAIDAAQRAIARGPEGLEIQFVVQDPAVQLALEDELSPPVERSPRASVR